MELYNLKLEQNLLAKLIDDFTNSEYALHSDSITEDMFFAERHRQMWLGIKKQKTQAKGEPVDVYVLIDYLEQKQVFENAKQSAHDYLQQILNSNVVTFSSSTATMIERLKDLALRRGINQAYEQSMASMQDESSAALVVLNNSIDKLMTVASSNTKSEVSDTSDIFKLMLDEMNYVKQYGVQYLTTGLIELDNTIKSQAGNLWIVAGRPSMGKTVLAENVMRAIAERTNKNAIFFSLEMSKVDLSKRMTAAIGAINISELSEQYPSKETWERATMAIGYAKNSLKLHISDDRSMTVGDMRATVAKIFHQHGDIGVIVVDYLQIINGLNADGNMRRDEKLSEAVRIFREIAQQYNCLVIMLSQVNRQCESRPDKRPNMGDLKESSGIEQHADIITFVYREDKYRKNPSERDGLVEIIVAKNRYGTDNTIRLKFEGQHQRMVNFIPQMESH